MKYKLQELTGESSGVVVVCIKKKLKTHLKFQAIQTRDSVAIDPEFHCT